MPVSRKRKKSRKSPASIRADRRREHLKQVRAAKTVRVVLDDLARADAQRVRAALPAAREFVADLAASTATGAGLEDELCARLGPLLARLGERRGADHIGPDHFAEAAVAAAREAIAHEVRDSGRPREARDRGGADESRRAGPERVLAALAAILPERLREQLALYSPTSPGPAGEVLWTRDRYGSRFAVAALYETPGGPARWYLWDVDACTGTPVPVHGGYYASPEEALAAWQVGVGAVAAGGTSWRKADDWRLLEEILPVWDGMPLLGGESAEQLAEHHRSRKLAELVLDLPGVYPVTRPENVVGRAAESFLAWRRRRPEADPVEPWKPSGAQDSAGSPGWSERIVPGERPSPAERTGRGEPDAMGEPDELRDLAETLAGAWPSEVELLHETCSPHRVAHVVETIRRDHESAWAGAVLALLPGWISWLAERGGTPPDLTARSILVARGEPRRPMGAARPTRVIE
ncbi:MULTISPECIES: hypothetical protein [Actinoplanes]|uniref:hypothetical protein n=1 Tax=Actinoplanes TaxID=1865 RepID=UPI0005F2DBA5|nr:MULTISPECIES: hypothetical protein [Actinoplanes]GLX99690.1 hypothetical protein Acsp01_00700 [Actinoplanes sp. NBRC 101535]